MTITTCISIICGTYPIWMSLVYLIIRLQRTLLNKQNSPYCYVLLCCSEPTWPPVLCTPPSSDVRSSTSPSLSWTSTPRFSSVVQPPTANRGSGQPRICWNNLESNTERCAVAWSSARCVLATTASIDVCGGRWDDFRRKLWLTPTPTE